MEKENQLTAVVDKLLVARNLMPAEETVSEIRPQVTREQCGFHLSPLCDVANV